MKKAILLFLLVIFASGWSPVEMLPAFKNLKADITGQLAEIFDREISVESVSGSLINQIELNNVSIAKEKKLSGGTIIKAKKIVINYNPFKLAASRGNIVSAISKIVIEEPDILVERSINDEWNMAGLLPKGKPSKGGQPKPLLFSGKVSIKGGYGLYVDHMGWGEDLKGRPFVSKIRDFNADVQISGNKISLSGTATSVIDKSVAFTRSTGNLNIKTGKYRFVVFANNVDMEKWGYYTLNIPHFKPISGRSDMKMTMTNPPPRKKGLPIFFDGQFNIKNGKAKIFDRLFENVNGFVSVHDEDARFKDLTGYRDGVPVTANGRLYDFSVANYDVNLDIPRTDFGKISRAFGELEGIHLSGNAGAAIHVGGNYAHPIFQGSASADGDLLKQKIAGKFNFYSEGTVLRVDSDEISAYGGRLYAKSIFDFTPSVPVFDVNVSGEGLSLKALLPVASVNESANLRAKVNGSMQKFTIKSDISTEVGGVISGFGTVEAGVLDMALRGGNLTLAGQRISDINAMFTYKNGEVDIASMTVITGTSSVSISGRTGIGCATDLKIETASAEASDIKMLETLLPKELTPVSGKLDASLAVTGFVTSETRIDPKAFSVSGTLRLRNGFVAYESYDDAAFNFSWNNSKLTFKDSRIKTDSSDLSLDGTLEVGLPAVRAGKAGEKIDLNVSGTLELADLRPLTLKYGRLYGSSRINCHLEGKTANPGIDIDFDGTGLRYNEIIVDRASGRLVYDGKNVFFPRPLDINQANDDYTVSGKVSLSKKPEVSLRLDVSRGDLSTAVALFDKIYAELGTKQIFGMSENQKTLVLYPDRFRLAGKGSNLIYKSDENKTTIEELKKAESEASSFSKTMKEKVGRNVKGKFAGFLEVNGTFDDLSGALDFKVSGGTWESYSFDEIGVKAGLEKGTFEVSSAYIRKGDGMLSARGFFNLRASTSLEITAENMPVDILSLFMGKGKSFDGNFNMTANLRGPVSSPSGSASIEAYKVDLGGVNLDSIISKLTYTNNTLFFDRTELVTGDKKAVISGLLPLAKDGISLGITMEGESIGLLTLFSPDISWISGTGQGFVKITGVLNHPRLNGALSLKDAAVSIKPMESNFQSINSEIKITDNLISTEGLSAKWAGKWTQNNINKIKLYGSVGLNDLFSKDRSVTFNLALKDGDFIVDFPNLYRGDLEVKNFSLNGPLWLAAENPKAPKLSGTFSLSNGVIILPDMTKKSNLPPLGLDMTVNILKNSYVSAGDIKNLISTDLSNLILNLEVEGQNILISGDLNAPIILGKTTFNQGTVNILNREFSLMTEDRQKEVFTSNLDLVKENSAVFRNKSVPDLTLSAEINVKSAEKTSSSTTKNPTYVTTNILVVSRITGTPFSKEKEEGMNLTFYSFKEDATKQPPELVPTGYDEEENKVLLLPDFIKGPLGISEKGVADVDANSVLADYLNSRLNAYLLRNVERDIAKDLELDSLTLEYNFGKDLRNMLPTTKSPVEIGPQEMPETMYGIGAVKGFFGRLYIDVKYSQAVEEQAVFNKAFLNYQLTYKLSPILSVVYYREPFSFIEQESDYYKVTLKVGYEL